MALALTVRTGAMAGRTLTFERPMISVGRAPDCDLVFDANVDIDVSGRHAEIVVIGSRVVLRDVGSTNGTWVNGVRLTSDAEIYDDDVIGFGEHGPQTVVGQTGRARPAGASTPPAGARLSAPATRISSSMSPSAAPSALPSAVPSAAQAPPTPAAPPAPSPRNTQMRIEAAVEKSTKKLQQTFIGVATVLAVGAVGAFWYGKQQATEALRPILAANDSLQKELASAILRSKGQSSAIDSVLRARQAEIVSLREQVAQGGSSEQISEFTRRMAEARKGAAAVMSAAAVDLTAINEKSGRAVALLVIEMPDGTRASATGFCVNEKGVIVTNRHAVRDPGTQTSAARIAVLFNETRVWLPAHLVRSSDGEDDLAVLQIDRPGPFPVVAGIAGGADAPKVGAAIATIGFPLGFDAAQQGTGTNITAKATLGPGTVSKLLDRLVQIDAYAAQGSSGSPVFDARGFVIGVVYGGPKEAAGRIVYAVPAARLSEELAK